MEERVFYIYRHIRKDTNVPFYIGRGKRKKNASTFNQEYYRAFAQSSRSDFWKKIRAKTDYTVEVVLDDLTREESIEKEKEFIALYKRIKDGGTLCNLTDGGEYFDGREFSEEEKLHIRIRTHKKRKGSTMSEDQKKKISLSMIEARKRKNWSTNSSDETKARALERLNKTKDIEKLASEVELPTPKPKKVKDKSEYEKPGPAGFPVICLDTGIVFDNSIEVAKAMYSHKNIKHAASSVLRVCNGKYSHYNGFKFQFV